LRDEIIKSIPEDKLLVGSDAPHLIPFNKTFTNKNYFRTKSFINFITQNIYDFAHHAAPDDTMLI